MQLTNKLVVFDKNRLQTNLNSISARATEVFGSGEKATRWLQASIPSLGYRTPLSLLRTSEGTATVEDTLGAIEHGTW